MNLLWSKQDYFCLAKINIKNNNMQSSSSLGYYRMTHLLLFLHLNSAATYYRNDYKCVFDKLKYLIIYLNII
jgi:hypothetical protein